ncbi:hypothetical protein HOLleu_20525 [Holothuria leucospilota]|uniref:Uncharacterized protein n=1 Tax=Holothuria leucospilota TaxID=206669 RepID=A0A9Q1H5R8_HOLLE|nr:hypothetical protein HOLleu_20525 [Holothuria leucospilota]
MLSLQSMCSNLNKDEVDVILGSELKGACIRSRVQLLDENEKPSVFFCREEKRRAQQKVINNIQNKHGQIVSRQNEIMDVFHNFYTGLFAEDCTVDTNMQDVFY